MLLPSSKMWRSSKTTLITVCFCSIFTFILCIHYLLPDATSSSSLLNKIGMYISNNNSGCSCPSNSMSQHADDESANTIPTIDKTISSEKDVTQIIGINSSNNVNTITQTNGYNMQLTHQHNQVMTMANNRSFSEHHLWYQEALMKKNEDLPLSKYDKTSKKILIWSYNWEGLPK